MPKIKADTYLNKVKREAEDVATVQHRLREEFYARQAKRKRSRKQQQPKATGRRRDI